MASTPALSARGSAITDRSPMPEYMTLDEERQRSNPNADDLDRYIGLAISENKLVWDLLEPQFNMARNVPARVAGYDDMTGSDNFRRVLANFLGEHVWGRDVDHNEVIALAGAGSVLELLFHALGDPGDGVLVPTPSYAGYFLDIERRDDMRVVPVHSGSVDGFKLNVADLQSAYDEATVPIKALLLTNPVNPTGRICSPEEIRDAVAWARSVGIHIVLNEIYALAAHGDTPFVASAAIIDEVGDDVHLVWAFSKDFAMSGLRCGVLTTSNEEVREAVSALAYWSSVSGFTQHLLGSMLSDEAWLTNYLDTMRSRLGESYRRTTVALDVANVPFLKADAGLFLLCDFRGFLAEQTWDGEAELWHRLIDECNVNLTPGSACDIVEPGFMRLCFAQEPPEVVELAIGRIAKMVAVRERA